MPSFEAGDYRGVAAIMAASALPTLDSTRLLAGAALREAVA